MTRRIVLRVRLAAIVIVGGIACGLLAGSVAAHDQPLTEAERKALQALVESIRTDFREGTGPALRLAHYQAIVAGVDDHGLGHVNSEDFCAAEPPDVRTLVDRTLRALPTYRGWARSLRHPDEVAFALAGNDEGDVDAAFGILRREEFTPGLAAVASTLSRDRRPSVRLEAGRLAVLMKTFGLETRECTAAVRNVIADRDPAVACVFLAQSGQSIAARGDLETVLPLLDDPRTRPAIGRGRLRGAACPVADAALGTLRFLLCDVVRQEAYGRGRDSLPARDAGSKELRAWWRSKPDGWVWGPDRSRWDGVVDETLPLGVGATQVVARPERTVSFRLDAFEESLDDGLPSHHAQMTVTSSDESRPLFRSRYPKRSPSFESEEMTSEWLLRLAYAPTFGSEVRVRCRLWKRKS